MIDYIKIKQKDSWTNEVRKIEFGKRNIIIGLKGSGKSTLFDLVANLADDKKLISPTVDAFAKFNLELVEVGINGESIPVSSLNRINLSTSAKKMFDQKEKMYSLRNDIISQDDLIKKDLTSDIDKDLEVLSKESLNDEHSLANFMGVLRGVYDSIGKVVSNDQTFVNWSVLHDIKKEVDRTWEVKFFNLNYQNDDEMMILRKDGKLLQETFTTLKENELFYKNKLMEIKQQGKSFIDASFYKESEEFFEKMLKQIDEYKKTIETYGWEIKKMKRIFFSFGKAFENEVSNIKKTNTGSKDKNIISFESSSLEHFKRMGSSLKKANVSFDKLITEELTLHAEGETQAAEILTLKVDEILKFKEEEKYALLKKVLYKAKKIETSVEGWIMTAREQGLKNFSRDLIINETHKKIKEKIKVLVGDEDYETMSLGQKSIVGIKYKFKKSEGMPMFLDQPEDNLDNHTVAKDVLSLINSKTEQMFIVTHNANIGILSNPTNVIVGGFDLKVKDEDAISQYKEGVIKNTENYSDSAHYLEGGIQYIKDRLEIIEGGN